MKFPWPPFVLAACLGLLLPGCSADGERWEENRGHGVLVIAIDGLRPDHLQGLGYDRPTTPCLDRLVEEGWSFEQTFTASPLLLPAHIGLLTGCDPSLARRYTAGKIDAVDERRWRVPPRVPRMAVEFLGQGFTTGAFLNSAQLEPIHGFDVGFQSFALIEEAEDGSSDSTALVMDRCIQWLRGLERERPWFAYVHLNLLDHLWEDPDPRWESFFAPRPELDEVPPVGNTDSTFFAIPRRRWKGAARTLGDYEATYDGHLRKLDAEIERLLAYLERAGRDSGTTIAVVGATGMQFGEAGMYLASGRYSMADLHVPMILRAREGLGAPAGRRSGVLASTLDLAPTLLGLEGMSPSASMHGRSLAPLLFGQGELAPREYVHASSGIQEGCVVIGERFCLEILVPGILENAGLVRSWTGESGENDFTPSSRFYDRLRNPFPPLGSGPRDGSREEELRYREVAATWVKDMEDSRTYLQARGPAFDKLGKETIERLRERGYVGNPR